MQEQTYDAKAFGSRLKAIRKANKYTQAKLAEVLFISEESVSNIEKGKTMCMPEHLMKICQLFNVSADYLYFGVERKLDKKTNSDYESILKTLEGCSDFDLNRIKMMLPILLNSQPAA